MEPPNFNHGEGVRERRKAILSGEQEQRAIKTLNSYTPEEIETKTILNQMVGSMEGVEVEGKEKNMASSLKKAGQICRIS